MTKFPEPESNESLIKLEIFNPSGHPLPFRESDAASLLKDIEKANQYLSHIEIVFTDEAGIIDINTEYLNRNYVTDIISFRLDEDDSDQSIEGTLYCCAPRIAEQSADYNSEPETEFLRIIIHGLLHLAGYNDQTESEKDTMTSLENHYLQTLYFLSDSISEYTLLIVESPTLASRLIRIVPDHVYVFATGGFLWMPVYNSKTGCLGKKAVPNKLDLRNELRREARHAVNVVVATDSDPSGDFIAWTIHKELHHIKVKRAYLTSLSSADIINLFRDASVIDFSNLFKRLRNRFRIRQLWNQKYPGISMRTAGLLALFGAPIELSEFTTDDSLPVFSNRPVSATLKHSQIDAVRSSEPAWIVLKPLSAFDVVARLRQTSGKKTYITAQDLLRRTFEATNPQTGDGLITYPRTGSRAFFASTWSDIQHQWIKQRSLNGFMPPQLQTIAAAGEAHDSIRPVHLNLSPEWVETHLPSDIGLTYRLIHSHSMDCIKIPNAAESVFSQVDGDIQFMSVSPCERTRIKLRPFLSAGNLGYQLCKLGVLRPSGFGAFLDDAIKKDVLTILESGEVRPGEAIRNIQERGPLFSGILKELRDVADNPALSDETIRRILTS